MSGLAAPSYRHASPLSQNRYRPSSLPDLPSAVSAAGDAITRSKLSPVSMRLIMCDRAGFPFDLAARCLKLRNDASSTCLKAPAVRTLSGSARAARTRRRKLQASATYLTHNMLALNMLAPPVQLLPISKRPAGDETKARSSHRSAMAAHITLLRLVGALDGGDSRGGDLLILLRRCATDADAADDDAMTMIGSPPCSSRWPALPIAGRS